VKQSPSHLLFADAESVPVSGFVLALESVGDVLSLSTRLPDGDHAPRFRVELRPGSRIYGDFAVPFSAASLWEAQAFTSQWAAIVLAHATVLDLGCSLRVTVREAQEDHAEAVTLLDLTLQRHRGSAYEWAPTPGASEEFVAAWTAALEKGV